MPEGIDIDSFGYVYVADTDNHNVQLFAPNWDLPLRLEEDVFQAMIIIINIIVVKVEYQKHTKISWGWLVGRCFTIY